MKLSIGFSPCPNDTFIFDALVNGKIDTGGLEFEPVLQDVEKLNQWAFEGKLDITKLSYPAFFGSLEHYTLLDSGAALGRGVGPLLVSATDYAYDTSEIENAVIAIPGENTTANLLLEFAMPGASIKVPMIFSSIEAAVLGGKTELGVIIHESRFTYQEKGLHKVMDLGEYWENQMKIPIPLGGIAIKRNIDNKVSRTIEKLIRNSIEFAFENYPQIPEYVRLHSQSMNEDVMRRHINLYVNDFSRSLQKEGRAAIRVLYEIYCKMKGMNKKENPLFLSPGPEGF